MKKYIKQIIALALIVSFASCSSDDEKVDMNSVGGNVILKTTSIARATAVTPVVINLDMITKSGVTVSKIEIYENLANGTVASTTVSAKAVVLGKLLTDATITTNVNPATKYLIATFSSSVLVTGGIYNYPTITTPGATFGRTPIQLAFVTTYSDGTKTNNPYVLTVLK